MHYKRPNIPGMIIELVITFLKYRLSFGKLDKCNLRFFVVLHTVGSLLTHFPSTYYLDDNWITS